MSDDSTSPPVETRYCPLHDTTPMAHVGDHPDPEFGGQEVREFQCPLCSINLRIPLDSQL